MSERTMLLRLAAIGLSKCGGRRPCSLAQAAAHNLRAEQNERGARAHIDPARTAQNRILHGPDTPAKIVALAQTIMASEGVDDREERVGGKEGGLVGEGVDDRAHGGNNS